MVCATVREITEEIKSNGINSAEVEHFDAEFKKLIKLIEGVKK